MSLLELMPEEGGAVAKPAGKGGRRAPRQGREGRQGQKAGQGRQAPPRRPRRAAAKARQPSALAGREAVEVRPREGGQEGQARAIRPKKLDAFLIGPGSLQFRRRPVERLGCKALVDLATPDKEQSVHDSPRGPKWLTNQQNVRASERFDLEVKVDLESDHNFYTGLTQNISAGGVFIATHHLRSIGDRITLKFTLPGSDKTVAVETEVRWIRENTRAPERRRRGTGMGVRFINLSPEASAAINASCRAANRCTTTTRSRAEGPAPLPDRLSPPAASRARGSDPGRSPGEARLIGQEADATQVAG